VSLNVAVFHAYNVKDAASNAATQVTKLLSLLQQVVAAALVLTGIWQ
jgi:hypothetical protein